MKESKEVYRVRNRHEVGQCDNCGWPMDIGDKCIFDYDTGAYSCSERCYRLLHTDHATYEGPNSYTA